MARDELMVRYVFGVLRMVKEVPVACSRARNSAAAITAAPRRVRRATQAAVREERNLPVARCQ